jgi:hypothetical protein
MGEENNPALSKVHHVPDILIQYREKENDQAQTESQTACIKDFIFHKQFLDEEYLPLFIVVKICSR